MNHSFRSVGARSAQVRFATTSTKACFTLSKLDLCHRWQRSSLIQSRSARQGLSRLAKRTIGGYYYEVSVRVVVRKT